MIKYKKYIDLGIGIITIIISIIIMERAAKRRKIEKSLSNEDYTNIKNMEKTYNGLTLKYTSDIDRQGNIIFIDWDDTLFPTSEIHDIDNIEKKFVESSEELTKSVSKVLELCLELSRKVYIVTNASKSWVEVCSQKMLAGISPLLSKCEIVSARQMAGDNVEAHLWKYITFKNIIEYETNVGLIKSITSIGDSFEYEFMAMETLYKEGGYLWTMHRIKMMDKPKFDKLLTQHQLLLMTLPRLVETPFNQDLQIYAEKKN